MHNLHALYCPMGHMRCAIIAFCIFFFVHILFYLCFMYKFYSPWNQYTDSTVSPCLCACAVRLCWGWSVEHWFALCVVYSGQCSALGVVSYAGLAISRQRFWHRSDLTELHRGIHDNLQNQRKILWGWW